MLGTIEFILKRQAQAEVEMAELRAMAKESDRRFDGIGKIVTAGMKMLVKFQKSRERDRLVDTLRPQPQRRASRIMIEF